MRPNPLAVAAGTGLIAALVHGIVVREHLAHWWGYGAFFAGVAAAQATAAAAVYRRPGRRLLIGVACGNLALIALYVVSRSVGTPFLGPHAGLPEAVGLIDLTAKAAEAAQLASVALVLRGNRALPQATAPYRRWAFAALAATAAAAFAAPVGPVHQSRPSPVLIAAGMDTAPEMHDLHLEDAPIEGIPTSLPPEEPPQSCTPSLGDAKGVPPRGDSGTATAIAYSHEGDLRLAAPEDGSVRRLTTDGYDCLESSPAFKDAETVAFKVDATIYDLDLRTGSLRNVIDVPGGVSAFAWSPDGTALAYTSWGLEDSPPSLWIFTPATREHTRVKSFAGGGGRCGSMDDESSVSWSPDGRSLLVVATYLDFSKETMFVVNVDGTEVVPARMGTHARWMPHARTVLFREFDEQRRWFVLDLANGKRTALPMQPGTHHAAVSRDGHRIAYSDDAERPALYLYDVAGGTERVLTRGYAAPMWLSAGEIVATKTRPCSDEECMGHGMWIGADDTAAFDMSGERTRSLSMDTTLDASLLMGSDTSPGSDAGSPAPSPPAAPSTAPTPSPDPSTPLPSPTESPKPSPTPTESPTAEPEPSVSPSTDPSPTPPSD